MKKIMSVLLVLCMMFCLFPVQALATDGHAITVIVEGDGYASAPQTAKAGDDVYINCTNGQSTELKEIIGVGPDGEFRIYPNDSYRPEFTMPDGPVTVTVKFGTIGDGDDDGGYGGEDSNIHTIMVLSAGGGIPIADKYAATAGETVTVTPNPNAGNVFKNIQIDYYRTDGHNEIYYLSDGATSFVMPGDIEPGGMVKVTVYYERDPNAGPVTTPQKIDTYSDGPGTVSAPETAVPGSTVTVSIVPYEGSKVIYLYAMNQGTGAELKMTRVGKTEYTFTMPENPAYVIVRFGAGEDNYVPDGGDDDVPGGGGDNTPDGGDDDVPGGGGDNGNNTAAHTTNPGGNAFYGDLAMRDEEILNLLVTPEDMAQGKDVVVYMEVKDITGGSIPGKSAIDARAAGDKIAAYLDITLYKKIGDSAPFTISNTGRNVTISLQLTDALIPANAGRDTFYIIYYHDGVAKETMAAFDPASRTLSFGAYEFSTYAIAYSTDRTDRTDRTYRVSFDANGGSGTMEAKQVSPGSFTLPTNGFTAPSGKEFGCWKVDGANKNPGDTITVNADVTVTAVWKNKTSGGTLDNVPKTGDTTGLYGWMLLSLCGAVMLASVAIYDKKRVR